MLRQSKNLLKIGPGRDPNGLWWRTTTKKAPRWMHSIYPEKPMHHNPSSHYYEEVLAKRPYCADRLDELPDEINPYKVKPSLEHRTNLTWVNNFMPGEDVHHLYWNTLLSHRNYNIEVLKAEDDRNWNYFIKRNGYSPVEYMESDTYQARYGGPCDDPDYYVYAPSSYFRKMKYHGGSWAGQDSCWYHDCDNTSFRGRPSSFEFNRDESYPYKALQGTYKFNSPCPLCRDWSLQLNYRNVPLLKQFIDPETGLQLANWKTHLCKFKHHYVSQAIEASRLLGYLEWGTAEPKFDEWHLPEYEDTPATGNLDGQMNKKINPAGNKMNFSSLSHTEIEAQDIDWRVQAS